MKLLNKYKNNLYIWSVIIQDWNLDKDWETHKTGTLVSKVFPQGPVAYVNFNLDIQSSYLSEG